MTVGRGSMPAQNIVDATEQHRRSRPGKHWRLRKATTMPLHRNARPPGGESSAGRDTGPAVSTRPARIAGHSVGRVRTREAWPQTKWSQGRLDLPMSDGEISKQRLPGPPGG